MTLRSTDYALLSQNSYQQPQLGTTVTLDRVDYKPIDYANDPRTGFQATAYDHRNADGSHNVVIAYRGTEFDREPVHDGGVDAGMVLTGLNAQGPDSTAFTQRVMDKVKSDAAKFHYSYDITVTGHSLGGTLAEINAHKFGLHGETFNAYGAAGLGLGIPAGGHQVIDHVRATDVVSAGAAHFGEVRTYATQQDIDALSKSGYSDNAFINALPAHAPILGKIQGSAHAIDNFVPQSKLLGQSIISPANEERYQAHHGMVDRYRNDIQDARIAVSAGWEIPNAVARNTLALDRAILEKENQGAHAIGRTTQQAAQYADHEIVKAYDATRETVVREAHVVHDKAVEGLHATEHAAQYVGHETVKGYNATIDATSRGIEATAHAGHQAYDATVNATSHGIEATVDGAKAVGHFGERVYDATVDATARGMEDVTNFAKAHPIHLDHPSHPDHAMYQQSLSAVHRLDAQNGRTPDHHSANLAAGVAVGARAYGLNKVDHVVLSDDGSRAFAVQGDLRSPAKQVANGVDTAQAVNTPIQQHSTTWQHNAQQAHVHQQTPQMNPQTQQQQANPVITR